LKNTIMEYNFNILLADNEEIVCQTMADYLKDMENYVDKIRKPNDILQKLEENKYDIVMIDMRIPGVDGLRLLSKIRKIRPEIIIITIVNHSDIDIALQSLKLGAADFLTKPIRLIEIDAMLEKVSRIRAYAIQNSLYLENLKEVRGKLGSRISKLESELKITTKKLNNEILRLRRIDVALKKNRNEGERG